MTHTTHIDYRRPPTTISALKRRIEARILESLNDPDVGGAAERDLSRYHAALAHALAELRLSPDEAKYLFYSQRGVIFDDEVRLDGARQAIQVDLGLDDEDRVAASWPVDVPALIERISAVGPLADLAIQDALERLGDGREMNDRAVVAKRLREVGLLA